MAAAELERAIQLLAKLPGLGPRSARRAVLALIQKRDVLMLPLAAALAEAAERVTPCGTCGNLDSRDPCSLCTDPTRDPRVLCVVEEVADLWALEKSAVFRGRFHVLGGTLSAIAGRDPESLGIERLVERARAPEVGEVILALSATVEGQTTAHYIAERLAETKVLVTRPAHGLPVGGELEYLDEGTLQAAFRARQPAA